MLVRLRLQKIWKTGWLSGILQWLMLDEIAIE
jgi:hypothetical protein